MLDFISARGARAIDVSSADADLGGAIGLYIGTSGDVMVDLKDGGTGVVFVGHPVGYLWAQVRKVYSTGTTAADILALY